MRNGYWTLNSVAEALRIANVVGTEEMDRFTVDDVLSAREAAERMGVSAQRVRQMIQDGRLPATRSSAGWLVPGYAVSARIESRSQGRPIEPRTAWAAIRLLSATSESASRMSPERSVAAADVVGDRRLRHRVLQMLAALPDPTQDLGPWQRLLASRGKTHRLWAHPGVLAPLAADPRVSIGGLAAAGPYGDGLTRDPGRLEIYVLSADVDTLTDRYRMRSDADGPVVLVAVSASVPPELAPAPGKPVPTVAAIADLLDEDDVRARNAARDRLRDIHRAIHTTDWVK